jgi:hypothetical protein
VRDEGSDNYTPLAEIGWQVHVYGEARPEMRDWCDSHSVPLHVFPWTAKHGKAGLQEDALYLLRPDTWVAFADGEQSTASLEQYLGSRGITLSLSP